MSLKFQSQIDISGCLILPPEIIRTLHLVPGTRVLIEEQDGKITLKPSYDEESGLMEKDGILILHTRIAEDVSEIIADHRENRKKVEIIIIPLKEKKRKFKSLDIISINTEGLDFDRDELHSR